MYRDKNKADIIVLITAALTKRGCHVIQSPGDADVDINVLRQLLNDRIIAPQRWLVKIQICCSCSSIIPEQTMGSVISVLMQTSIYMNATCIILTC